MKKGIGILFMLTLVVVLASVGVFFVEGITTPIIEDRQRAEIQAAVEGVFPDIVGTTWTVEDSTLNFSGSPITGAKEIKDGANLVGIVYTVVFRGFSSDITYVVGVNRSGQITGYQTISQNDTAGYGAQIADAANWEQFKGMLLDVAGSGTFDGLTGASVTTGAWKQSFADVAAWHNKNEVFPPLTQFDIDSSIIKSAIGDGFTITEYEVTGVKTLEDYGIDLAYLATSSDKTYVAYIEEYESYNPDTKVLLIVDTATNETVTFQVLANGDTEGWGAALLDSSRWAQLEGVDQDFLFNGEFDDLGGATTTYRLWQDAMQRISIFHQAEFLDTIRYTTVELMSIYQEQLSVEFTSSITIEDVTSQKIKNINISNIYDVKDSLGNVVGTVYYAQTFGANNGSPTFIQLLIGVDSNGDFTGLRVLETTDPTLENSSLLITDPKVFDGTDYFADEIVGLSVTDEITLDVVAGFEIQVASIENVVTEIGRYHDEDYPKRDDIVVADEYLAPAFTGATSFTSIYSDYNYKNGVVNVYEAYDAGDVLLGYVYAATYTGNNSDILYTIGIDLTGTTVGINVYSGNESWGDATFASYDGSQGTNFRTSTWLNNFVGLDDGGFVTNYTPATNPVYGTSTDIDAVSGVSTTTGGDGVHFGLIDSVYNVLKFHVDNSVGGAS